MREISNDDGGLLRLIIPHFPLFLRIVWELSINIRYSKGSSVYMVSKGRTSRTLDWALGRMRGRAAGRTDNPHSDFANM